MCEFCGGGIHCISRANLAIVDCAPLKAEAEYGRLLNKNKDWWLVVGQKVRFTTHV